MDGGITGIAGRGGAAVLGAVVTMGWAAGGRGGDGGAGGAGGAVGARGGAGAAAT